MPARRKPLPPPLQGRLFSRRQAEEAGVTAGLLRGPAVQSLVRGVYLSADQEPTLAQRLSAFLTTLPSETAVDGISALQYWGVEMGAATPYRFVTTACYQSTRPSVRVRRVRELPACRGVVVAPVPALVAARIEFGLLQLVMAGDWLVRAKRATLEEVQRGLAACGGRHCVRARRAGALVRARVESPRETTLRLVVVLSGLPEPECNVELGDDMFFIGRVDLYLRGWGIAIEYEGDQHRTDAAVFGNDLTRFEQLAAAGILAVRVSKQHLRQPHDVAARIYRALVSRGYDGPPPNFGPEWRAVFGSGPDARSRGE